ncbi:MAG: helix-turn-helix domain-containing protein [Sphingomonadales bacterium]
MTGHRRFSDLKKGWDDERRARNDARKAELAAEYATLEELRVALGLSQEELARRLDVQQPAVSRLANRGDMRISTLRGLIEAMGGELHVTATFADRTVELANFD